MTENARADIEAAIARMRDMAGAERELRKLPEHLRDGERVEMIVAGQYEGELATGILVLTDRRLLFVKDGPLSKRSEDFPLAKITSVQWESTLGLHMMTVYASGNKTEFCPLDKADGLAICAAVRERLTEVKQPSADGRPAGEPGPLELLAKLGELHSAGVLTDEEFAAKKAELLDRI